MRKRDIQIITRLNKKEHEHLKKCVKRSTLSQEGYLRFLINGLIAPDYPSPDYHRMTNELRCVGRNINQIAIKAHMLNVIDAEKFDKAYAEYLETYLSIKRAISEYRMVDSNVQRENILPSEKAFAYKMKLDAIKRQAGRPKDNSVQLGLNFRGKASRDLLAQI